MLLPLTIDEPRFVGMNDRFPSELLPPGLFQKILNANVGDNKLSKRPGNTAVATTLGAFAILGGSAFEPAGGTKLQIVCLDGASNSQLYKWTGSSTFSAIGSANLTAGATMNFVQASNYLFGFNGTDAVDYDGTTVTKNRATVPLGKFGIWFHNYLFVSGVTATPNRVFWSDLGTPTTFTGANFVDIQANDGDSITGMSIFNDELVIFKNNSLHSISGWSGSTFSATTIAGQNTNTYNFGFGTPSHNSIIPAGHNLYYLSFVGGVPHIRMLERTAFGNILDAGIASLDIDTTMNGLNKTKLNLCAGIYDGKKIIWSLANGSSLVNNLCIVLRPDITMESTLGKHNSWVTYDSITPCNWWMSTVSGQAKIYWGDANATGLVNQFETSVYTDNGTAITMDIRSRDYQMDYSRKAKFKYVFPKYATGSAGTLKVNARIDKAVDFALQKSISLGGNSPGLGPTGTFTLGTSLLGGSTITKTAVTLAQLTGSMLGLQFKESTANSCDVYEYQIIGQKKGLRTNA